MSDVQNVQLLFDLFAEDSWRNVYAGELELRPPGAPTTQVVCGAKRRRYQSGRRLEVAVNGVLTPWRLSRPNALGPVSVSTSSPPALRRIPLATHTVDFLHNNV
jgi:hypothetical protein